MATRVKRYEDRLDRLDEMLARIEDEMGSEAELETRRFSRGRFLGLWGGQQMVEIVATLEVSPPPVVMDSPEPAGLPAGGADAAPGEAVADSVEPDAKAQSTDEATADSLVEQLGGTPRSIDLVADDPVDDELAGVADSPEVSRLKAGIRGREPVEPAGSGQHAEVPVAEAPAADSGTDPARQQDAISAAAGSAEPQAEADNATDIKELKHSITELKQAVQLVLEQQLHAAEASSGAAAAYISEQQGQAPAEDQLAQQQLPLVSLGGADPLVAEHLAQSAAAEGGAPLTVLDPVSVDPGTSLAAIPRKVFDRILDWNIGPYDAIELINKALAQLEGETGVTEDGLLQTISRDICRNILLSDGIKLKPSPSCKVVALIGGTGVGKTTTIAKLAAQFAFQAGKRVSLVSLDNYRIAAAEQLRTYTDIMGIDLDIVFSRDEFDEVLTQRRHSDLVLIDTAGRSPLNTKQIFELRDVFSAHPPDEVHLVIAASTKGDDLKMIIENFEPLSYDHVIVSKLDETRSLGCIYNINKHCKIPISYFTVGQSVPEDIRTATLAFIQEWIQQGRII